MLLIGFTGQAGSGKSTAVQHIKDTNLEKQVYVMKFAQPLYDIQEFVYRRVEKFYKRPESFSKDRKLLQWLGTEWGRSLDQNLWVNLWKSEVEYARENYPHSIILCDDVRFDNEADMIKQLGGIVVKVECSKIGSRLDAKVAAGTHASEAGVSKKYVDITVVNDYTKKEFESSIDEVLKLTKLTERK